MIMAELSLSANLSWLFLFGFVLCFVVVVAFLFFLCTGLKATYGRIFCSNL